MGILNLKDLNHPETLVWLYVYPLLFVFHFIYFFSFAQSGSLFLHPSGHEFIGNGLQQFGFLSIGPHKVCFSGWNRLALQLNPSPFLFGFLLFLIIFLHTFQEAISALIKANAPINTECHSNAQTQLTSGKVKFLVDERTAKEKLLGTAKG